MTGMEKCARCGKLSEEVAEVLQHLRQLTTTQLEAFRGNDIGTFMRLDKELENEVGRKERAFGAWREHRAEHEDRPVN
jgi:hypothetical protein